MRNKKLSEEEILTEVEVASSKINEKSLNEIIAEAKEINDKSASLDAGRFKKLIRQIRLAVSLIKDFRSKRYTQVPWRTIALISTAILYFFNPFDMMPDFLPLLGITDDALLFATVFKSIQADLEKYGRWKGIDTEEYF